MQQGARDLLLKVEQLFTVYAKVIGPQDRFRLGVDQLDADAHPFSRAPQAATAQISNAQTLPNLAGRIGLKVEQK